MSFASGEYEVGIAAFLNMCSENSFHVLLWIVTDLLKFIDGDDTFLFSLFQT